MKKIDLIHPGEVLAEEFMVPRRLTAHRLALDLHVPSTRINDLVRGKRSITADTALRLARYFDTSAALWMNLQTDYDLRVARRESGERIEREVAVAG